MRETDPTISDEKARSALGALGLIGEKAIRKVGHLSGKYKFCEQIISEFFRSPFSIIVSRIEFTIFDPRVILTKIFL